MAGELQPLDQKFAIVDQFGRPTQYFTRWAQQRQIDIGTSITLGDLEAFLTAHKLAPGHGIILTPDGDINNLPNISVANGTGLNFDVMGNLKIADTAVTPGTYGDATHVPAIVVDQQGRITGVTLVAISGGGGGATTLGRLNEFAALQTPSINYYLSRLVYVEENFTINKIAFACQTANAACLYRPFVYACGAGVFSPTTLLGSGPQVTGTVVGYNEAPLSAPVAVTKGSFVFLGVNQITSAMTNLCSLATGLVAFTPNAGSSTPANPFPGPITVSTAYTQIYPFWGVT